MKWCKFKTHCGTRQNDTSIKQKLTSLVVDIVIVILSWLFSIQVDSKLIYRTPGFGSNRHGGKNSKPNKTQQHQWLHSPSAGLRNCKQCSRYWMKTIPVYWSLVLVVTKWMKSRCSVTHCCIVFSLFNYLNVCDWWDYQSACNLSITHMIWCWNRSIKTELDQLKKFCMRFWLQSSTEVSRCLKCIGYLVGGRLLITEVSQEVHSRDHCAFYVA